ncbi:hypothetical protein LTS10_000666 [Elasticomyces elasticus]|nr:hypothetical protein LTS10_000666 [Elasticomyces elasticus]
MAPSSTPDKWPSADMFGETIEVRVGKAQKSFTVHRGAVSFYSGYFEAAVKKTFKEGSEGVIELPTEDVAVLELFVRWLYTRRLPETPATGDNFNILVNLWLFTDRRECPLLANQLLDAMRDEIVRLWQIPTYELHNVYENTTESSGLRRLCLYIISRTTGASKLTDANRARWPADALWDLAKSIGQLREDKTREMGKDELAKLSMCQFHTHENGVECSKK